MRTTPIIAVLLALLSGCKCNEETPVDTTTTDSNAVAIQLVRDYVDAYTREVATRTQATGEHPVAEQALRDIEMNIKGRATGDEKAVFNQAIHDMLEKIAVEVPKSTEHQALEHLHSVIND